jgi:hypothetical protein
LETDELAATVFFNENVAGMGKVLIETLKNLIMRVSIRATLHLGREV